jgi:type I restriction enzyme S subunit
MKLNQYKTKSAQPGLSVEKIEHQKIPVPPLKVQSRIVAILDRFDTLCTDITSGLPAEIEARRKQYEYYRDKLLTFEIMENEKCRIQNGGSKMQNGECRMQKGTG